jgi:hypothetical protein
MGLLIWLIVVGILVVGTAVVLSTTFNDKRKKR